MNKKYHFKLEVTWDNLKDKTGTWDMLQDYDQEGHRQLAKILSKVVYSNENFYKLLKLTVDNIDKDQQREIYRRKKNGTLYASNH